MKILNRFSSETQFEDKSETVLETVRAAILAKADLRCADLRCANLRDAYLWCANLWDADLRGADLRCANLRDAYLLGANLEHANLWGADLRGANLRDAYLWCANLWGANLLGANLRGANLRCANLEHANLWGANLGEKPESAPAINWQSHDLVADLLRRWAGDEQKKREVAGLVLVSRDWCWKRFLKLKHPFKNLAIEHLKQFVKPGDNWPHHLIGGAK